MKKTYQVLGILGLFLIAAMVLFSGCGKNDDASAATGTNHWLTDFEKAKEIARNQSKDLMLNFAGSDWCYWCQTLDKEVFLKASFIKKAEKDFVFVLVDFPNVTSGQSAAIQQQNEKLAEQFGIEGFPTVFLADASGKPYAQTGYLEGGVQAYLEHLKGLRNQKAAP